MRSLVLIALFVVASHALLCAYTGPVAGAWVTRSNWNCSQVPSVNDVVIFLKNVNLTLDAPRYIRGLSVGTSVSVYLTKALTLTDTYNPFSINSIFQNNGTLGVNGDLTINYLSQDIYTLGEEVFVNSGSLYVSGNINVNLGPFQKIFSHNENDLVLNTGYICSDGKLNVTIVADNSLASGSQLRNDGTISSNSLSLLHVATQTSIVAPYQQFSSAGSLLTGKFQVVIQTNSTVPLDNQQNTITQFRSGSQLATCASATSIVSFTPNVDPADVSKTTQVDIVQFQSATQNSYPLEKSLLIKNANNRLPDSFEPISCTQYKCEMPEIPLIKVSKKATAPRLLQTTPTGWVIKSKTA
eukprot:TRINITY_DN1567_c0_g1_i1.p1 TRINITY_DN1567_c0_g1~~TRINITY_DN1567_c0_g1_i1.p1  ORF type:complete len:355 (-),score=37.62 TRINITY_DN1567_c0_g1_i1:74-1138(-)